MLKTRLTRLWRNLLRRPRVELDLTEEVRAYIDLLTQAKMAEGASPDEARRAALIEFGGMEQVKEKVREIRMGHLVETILQDFRFAVRMLTKNPGFTIAALTTLMLGIGSNTAIFSVVNSVLLRPLPYPQADRLMILRESSTNGGPDINLSSADFLDVQATNQVFEQMAVYREATFNLIAGDRPIRIDGADVTTNLFSVLGESPFIGRDFLPEDGGRATDRGVLLGYPLWQEHFGGDTNIAGHRIILDGQGFTVVGVMPRGFDFPGDVQLWVAPRFSVPAHPRTPDINPADTRGAHYLFSIGRLKPGVTGEAAVASLGVTMQQIVQQVPDSDLKGYTPHLQTLHNYQVGESRQTLLILLGLVGLVFLIASANVANLMLARGAARQKEFAVRTALGASRARLAGQFITESLVLAGLGGALGLAAAIPTIALIAPLAPSGLGAAGLPRLDSDVLAFTAVASLISAMLFGLAPILQTRSKSPSGALKQGGRGSAVGTVRSQEVLVTAEIALAVVLLIGGGLLVRTFVRLLKTPLGFDSDHILTMSLTLAPSDYPRAQDRDHFVQNTLAAVAAVPGIRQVSAVTRAPINPGATTRSIQVEGRTYSSDNDSEPGTADYCSVSPAFFHVFHIPLVEGREFSARDDAAAPKVVLINRAMARAIWHGDNPIGQRIHCGDDDWHEVVGIVGDIHQHQVDQKPRPAAYVPYAQDPWPYLTLAARTEIEPSALAADVERAIHTVDKNEAVASVRTVDDVVARSISGRRFNALLIGLFAGLALVLSAIGIFGVTSFAVGRRIHEMGVRVCLGATPRDVLRLILGRSLALALLGAGAGLVAAFGLTRLMASLLYGVAPTDPLTFATVAAALLGSTLLASYLPARRATKVDPSIALRCE